MVSWRELRSLLLTPARSSKALLLSTLSSGRRLPTNNLKVDGTNTTGTTIPQNRSSGYWTTGASGTRFVRSLVTCCYGIVWVYSDTSGVCGELTVIAYGSLWCHTILYQLPYSAV